MTSKVHVILAFLITLIAVLYQIEGDSNQWAVDETAKFYTTPERLFKFIVNPDQVSKWMLWAPGFRPADSRPIGLGKKYFITYKIPLLGPQNMVLRVVEYRENELIVLESDHFFRPKFALHVQLVEEGRCDLTMSLKILRTSALYRYTLGPIVWILSTQQIRHSLFVLRMMIPF